MGFITNQWLLGHRAVNRSHSPVPVRVSGTKASSDWERVHNVVYNVYATRDGSNYQALYLTNSDLAEILPALATVADASTSKQFALKVLGNLDTSTLLEVLREHFSADVYGEEPGSSLVEVLTELSSIIGPDTSERVGLVTPGDLNDSVLLEALTMELSGDQV